MISTAPSTAALMMRARRAGDREAYNKAQREYRSEHYRYVVRAKKLGDRLCGICEIKLTSARVALRTRKYCDDCLRRPDIKRRLRNLYQRRIRQKALGLPIEPIVLHYD